MPQPVTDKFMKMQETYLQEEAKQYMIAWYLCPHVKKS